VDRAEPRRRSGELARCNPEFALHRDRRTTALFVAALTATTSQAAPNSQAAPPPGRGQRPVHCEFTPTPENPAAKPVRLPTAKAKSHMTTRNASG
jgi:hypothetical protein